MSTETRPAASRTRRWPSAAAALSLTAALLSWSAPSPATADAAEPAAAPTAASVVEVTGSQGDWELTVDGAPYTVQGLTWGPSTAAAAQYMPDLASMGVNTVRTWGTDATTAPLLDAAAANGIRVIAGFWLQPGGGPGSGGCVDYVNDHDYKGYQLYLMNQWVGAYRDHPGVLMWNVGNESLLGLQNCYSGAQLEAQRDAYAQFVNDAAEEIRALDPNHPVTSTDAWTGAWPYYQEHAPALDLLAVNAYDAVCGIEETWAAGGYDRPYILTEGGPAGEWEVPDDVNGVPLEPTDVQKRDGYRRAWECLMGHEGVALGGTLFHYGIEEDFGGVWFNLLPGGERRLSYYEVAELYGGDRPTNTPPVITGLTVGGDRTAVEAGEGFGLSANVSDPDGDAVSYEVMLSSRYVDDSGALVPAASSGGGGSFTVTAPERPGVWKVYLLARDGRGNIGIETTSIRVVPPDVDGTNIARGAATTASSWQGQNGGEPFPPGNATDGNPESRWASDWSDPQWIQVDLGSVRSFHHVQLVWETAYGRAYQVQTSTDGANWTTVHQETAGNGGVDSIPVGGSGRYVRVLGTGRGTSWGYSLYEFGVYAR
ncbi:discoidin domain-containing protein [Allonocardiopsis opalescens]|uniref:Exo-beta-1,3-glucanase (GH17 family) n=1 Tax=Allonocardiopsis opalescens TaxID=1144618 RepID=A0A2T0PYZ2_9ACTN|nr:discoidin domain-containing protein [Allonocardiopsis opalescens]PRX96741.1 exo-beta-1,3-glucanase (GH17 family) [Allonocardiopsis opalescens]